MFYRFFIFLISILVSSSTFSQKVFAEFVENKEQQLKNSSKIKIALVLSKQERNNSSKENKDLAKSLQQFPDLDKQDNTNDFAHSKCDIVYYTKLGLVKIFSLKNNCQNKVIQFFVWVYFAWQKYSAENLSPFTEISPLGKTYK